VCFCQFVVFGCGVLKQKVKSEAPPEESVSKSEAARTTRMVMPTGFAILSEALA